MDFAIPSHSFPSYIKNIDDVPDEVLEFIMGFLPPYNDLISCMFVCKRWYNCSQNVKRKTAMKLVKAIAEFKILWKNITPGDILPTITKRFSHAACVLNNSMYIFGGCTTNATAFNDLWRFDLSNRQWVRPVTTGTYPVPKAYTSMVCYKDNLILFGGWTYPSPSQYYQTVTMFNDIHLYNVTTSRWILVEVANGPPAMAGHSACIINNEMVVFGGLVKSEAHQFQIQCSNEVWVFNLDTKCWRKQPTTSPRPLPRYAQSMVMLDDDRLMLLGGAQTIHNRFVYNDCWILNMKGPTWTWKELAVKNKEWAAANIWCNPACKVGNKVVSLSRSRNGWNSAKPFVTSAVRLSAMSRPEGAPVAVRVEQSLRRPVDKDQNINGKRGVLPRQQQSQSNLSDEPLPGPSNKNQPGTSDSSNADFAPENNDTGQSSADMKNRDLSLRNRPFQNGVRIVRQLQEANRYRMAAFACDPPNAVEPEPTNQRQPAQAIRQADLPPANQPAVKKFKRNTLTMHVLDIATVVDGNSMNYVSWLCPKLGEATGAPEEMVMYSLVKGNGELIMFGGVQNDLNILNRIEHDNLYSNSLHFITPPRDTI